jgi:hypothetical protein
LHIQRRRSSTRNSSRLTDLVHIGILNAFVLVLLHFPHFSGTHTPALTFVSLRTWEPFQQTALPHSIGTKLHGVDDERTSGPLGSQRRDARSLRYSAGAPWPACPQQLSRNGRSRGPGAMAKPNEAPTYSVVRAQKHLPAARTWPICAAEPRGLSSFWGYALTGPHGDDQPPR